jgi:hypothetical protein
MEPEVTTIWDDPNKPTFVVRLSSPMTRRGRLVGTYLLAALFSSITYGLSVLTIPGDAGDSGTDRSQVTEWKIEVWGRANLLVGFMHPYFIKVRR